MSLLIKLVIDLVCGGLNALGGWHILWMRRYLMPFILAVSVSVITGIWWQGFLLLPVMGTLSLGYSKGGNFGRAVWLLIQALVIGLGLAVFHHLNWFIYIAYVIGAGILGGFYSPWPQILGDSITGCYLAGILFLVR